MIRCRKMDHLKSSVSSVQLFIDSKTSIPVERSNMFSSPSEPRSIVLRKETNTFGVSSPSCEYVWSNEEEIPLKMNDDVDSVSKEFKFEKFIKHNAFIDSYYPKILGSYCGNSQCSEESRCKTEHPTIPRNKEIKPHESAKCFIELNPKSTSAEPDKLANFCEGRIDSPGIPYWNARKTEGSCDCSRSRFTLDSKTYTVFSCCSECDPRLGKSKQKIENGSFCKKYRKKKQMFGLSLTEDGRVNEAKGEQSAQVDSVCFKKRSVHDGGQSSELLKAADCFTKLHRRITILESILQAFLGSGNVSESFNLQRIQEEVEGKDSSDTEQEISLIKQRLGVLERKLMREHIIKRLLLPPGQPIADRPFELTTVNILADVDHGSYVAREDKRDVRNSYDDSDDSTSKVEISTGQTNGGKLGRTSSRTTCFSDKFQTRKICKIISKTEKSLRKKLEAQRKGTPTKIIFLRKRTREHVLSAKTKQKLRPKLKIKKKRKYLQLPFRKISKLNSLGKKKQEGKPREKTKLGKDQRKRREKGILTCPDDFFLNKPCNKKQRDLLRKLEFHENFQSGEPHRIQSIININLTEGKTRRGKNRGRKNFERLETEWQLAKQCFLKPWITSPNDFYDETSKSYKLSGKRPSKNEHSNRHTYVAGQVSDHSNEIEVLRSRRNIKIPVLFEELCRTEKADRINHKVSNVSMRFVLVQGDGDHRKNLSHKLIRRLSQIKASQPTNQYIFGVTKCCCR